MTTPNQANDTHPCNSILLRGMMALLSLPLAIGIVHAQPREIRGGYDGLLCEPAKYSKRL